MNDETAPETPTPPPPPTDGFVARNKAGIGLAVLAVYVVLLAIGTVAELFDIRWILDWPIY
jgi:hypothetical protein